jgi:hypothetical protein
MTGRRTDGAHEEERLLHARLLAGERAAASDLAYRYLDELADWLTAHNPNLHPNDCEEVAADVLMALAKHPSAYKPDERSLTGYLRMAATADLRNLVRRQNRRRFPASRRAGERFRVVELSTLAGNDVWEISSWQRGQGDEQSNDDEANPALAVANEYDPGGGADAASTEASSVAADVIRQVRARCSESEERVLNLLLVSFRQPAAAVAEALGLNSAPQSVQRREAKRILDRLKKRIERAAAKTGARGRDDLRL